MDENTSLPESYGLAEAMRGRPYGWNSLKASPLRSLISLNEQQGEITVFSDSFESRVRAAGTKPLDSLSTEDLIAVTNGLLTNLRKDSNPHNADYTTLMKLIWKHHVNEIKEGGRKTNIVWPELVLLSQNIANVAKQKHDEGAKLDDPALWNTHVDLRDIGRNIDRLAMHIDLEAMLNCARKDFEGMRIKSCRPYETGERTYMLEVKQPARFNHALKPEKVENFFYTKGVLSVSRSGNHVQVVPFRGSAVELLLQTLEKAGQERS